MPDSHVTDTLVFRSSELPAETFLLCSLQGHEAISQPYEFRIVLRTLGMLDDGDVEKLLTKPVYVAFGLDESDKFHGAVRAIEISPHPDGRSSRIAVTMVPRLWYLSQTRRSQVFLDLSVPEIVKAVLVDAGLEDGTDFALRVQATHPKRDYTVQYQETDLQFVSRLLEHEGIFYFFEHGDENEKLVLADANASFLEVPGHETVSFRPLGGAVDSGDSVLEIRQITQTVPRFAYVRDYNDQMSASILMNDRKTAIDESGWPVDRTGHGFHVTEDENVLSVAHANRVAGLRAEEQLARKHQFVGRTSVRSLRSGLVFTLEGHGATAFDRKYVVTELEHSCEQEAQLDAPAGDAAPADATHRSYSNEFVAITETVAFRPARLTPKPKIYGAIYATIDGANDSTAAPIDDEGRYRVLLPFDTVGQIGGKATHPIRMAQSYSGPGYGMHLPLHRGAEVLLVHIDGDPDRPVIAATLPNRTMPTPSTSAFATRSVIQSRSAIRIEFDDDA